MKKVSLILMVLAMQVLVYSQGCLPQGITFSSQEQIDNFQTNYPGCSVIEGFVVIEGADITNLNGLSGLTSIEGTFRILNNDALTSLTGLNNLLSIPMGIRIENNSSLGSLEALSNLTSAGGFIIGDNNALTSLDGLENLPAAAFYGIHIYRNSSLSSCDILPLCEYLADPTGPINIFGNAPGCSDPVDLANVCGVSLASLPYGNYNFHTQSDIDNFAINYPGVTEIQGTLSISEDADINNLNGLSMITSVENYLTIRHNHFLTDLSGLENLTNGQTIYISQNTALTSLSGLNNLTTNNPGGADIVIHIIENEALTSLAGIENIDPESIQFLFISGNPLLSTCDVNSICGYVASPNGYLEIENNAPGCNSPEEVEEDCLVNINKNTDIENGVQIFPNPATNNFSVLIPPKIEILGVTIYSQTGQKALTIKSPNKTIDISNLKPGLYFAEIRTSEGDVMKKIIIQ